MLKEHLHENEFRFFTEILHKWIDYHKVLQRLFKLRTLSDNDNDNDANNTEKEFGKNLKDELGIEICLLFTLFGETWYKVEYSLQRKSDLRYRETNEIANSAEAETKSDKNEEATTSGILINESLIACFLYRCQEFSHDWILVQKWKKLNFKLLGSMTQVQI